MVLKTKIIVVIVISLLLTIGTSTAVVFMTQSKMIKDAKVKDVGILSDLVEKSIAEAMQSGKTADVQKILENIGENPEIASLRILSAKGKILRSKLKTEIGEDAKEILSDGIEKQFIVSDKSISYFKPVFNKAECYRCHNKKEKLTGIIQIEYDMTRSRNEMFSIKKLFVLSNIISVSVVAAILSLLFSVLIINPLKKLQRAMKDFESGNWEARAHVENNDEIGTISGAFNRMTEKVKHLHERNINREKEMSKIKIELENKMKLENLNKQLNYKIKEVETANKAAVALSKEVRAKNIQLSKMVDRLCRINDTGKTLSSIIDTDELMRHLIKTTAELLYAGKGVIHLERNNKQFRTLSYQYGAGFENCNEITSGLMGIYNGIACSGNPSIIREGNSDKSIDYKADNSVIGVPLKIKGQLVGAMLLEDKLDGTAFNSDELELLTIVANQAMVAIENAWLYESIKETYLSTMQSLINALEANDRYTKGHSERVRYLSMELGRHLGLDDRELETLQQAAVLHDIGKIGIDSMILNKEGKLTASEFNLIKAHPLIGEEILCPVEALNGVRITIIQHHERYDGKGYPFGVPGEEISLKARILSVIDTFDAMLSDRPYRRSLPLIKAKEELRIGSGTQFDPHIVNAFLDMLNKREGDFLASAGYRQMPVAV